MSSEQRLLVWLGSSKKDLVSLPVKVRKFFGHALDFAQRGEQHIAAKVLKGFGGAGVLELVEDDGARGLHGEVQGSRVCPSCLSEEEQERQCHQQGRP
jgi:phage-related protein